MNVEIALDAAPLTRQLAELLSALERVPRDLRGELLCRLNGLLSGDGAHLFLIENAPAADTGVIAQFRVGFGVELEALAAAARAGNFDAV